MYVLGTAGHIDHGKTTLIQALTGINPDRLKEEQKRGMTIDLGFAWLSLPSGTEVGIVDVPGHHRFIKNMLAGVSAINLLLLVIAADDGWMPQTQEHVAIADLLGISNCIVVVTKCDLVDEDWLDLICQDIQENLSCTSLASSPLVCVSSHTRDNLDTLLTMIDQGLHPKEDQLQAPPLLWIDRVFTIKGSGTVVTGTLLAGTLSVDDQIRLEPAGITTKIRGLQTHKAQIQVGQANSRLAINLNNVATEAVTRGMYVTYPQMRPAYSCINATITLLASAPATLGSLDQVKLYVGTAELSAKTRLLQNEPIQPGETGLLQLILDEPTHFRFKDRFIIRHPSYATTIGGGRFLAEGIPVRGRNFRLIGRNKSSAQFGFETSHPRLDQKLLKQLAAATHDEYPLLLAQVRPFWTESQFIQHGGSQHAGLISLDGYILGSANHKKVYQKLLELLKDYHLSNPLKSGIPKETLRTMMSLPLRLFDSLLTVTREVVEDAGIVRLATHQIQLSPKEHAQWDQLYQLLTSEPFSPPTLVELKKQGFPLDLMQLWIDQRKLVLLHSEQITLPGIIAQVQEIIRTLIHASEDKSVSLADIRDRLNTSRKYTLVFLEYFDDIRFTKRIEDKRILG